MHPSSMINNGPLTLILSMRIANHVYMWYTTGIDLKSTKQAASVKRKFKEIANHASPLPPAKYLKESIEVDHSIDSKEFYLM